MTWHACVRALQAQADRPPAAAREALLLAGQSSAIGSIEPALARRMAEAGLPVRQDPSVRAWRIAGAADACLTAIAHWLAAQGLAGRWRDERLTVTDAEGVPVAMIERAAVRPLGIATRAVHLIGLTPDGGFWVQQRALDKSTDPGLWDTLMGGLMAADESIAASLARETWEEAGLQVDRLLGLDAQADLVVRRPVAEGYLVERIHVFAATVPDGMVPVNQDGEVARFELLDAQALRERIIDGGFTLEAALILARYLDRADAA